MAGLNFFLLLFSAVVPAVDGVFDGLTRLPVSLVRFEPEPPIERLESDPLLDADADLDMTSPCFAAYFVLPSSAGELIANFDWNLPIAEGVFVFNIVEIKCTDPPVITIGFPIWGLFDLGCFAFNELRQW